MKQIYPCLWQLQALYSPGVTMQLLEELEELISSLRAKHPAVAISFSTKVEEKPEDQEPSAQPTSSRKTPPAKHARSAKPPAKKKITTNIW